MANPPMTNTTTCHKFNMHNHNLAPIAVCLWLAAFALTIAIVFSL